MMAASLILTGGLQLMLTRFVADLFFTKEEAKVLPNLLGAQLITTLGALLSRPRCLAISANTRGN